MIPALALLVLLQVDGATPPPPPPEVDDGPALSALKGADLALLGEVRRIATKVEALREQQFQRPPLALRVRQDMRHVASEIRAYSVLPPDRLEARGRAWADVGLGEASTPETLLRFLAADLEGIGFDPTGNRLLVAPNRLTVEDFESSDGEGSTAVLMMTGVRPDEPMLSHLLVHVRQRERLGGDVLRPTTDELLAGAAWAEGEANLLAIRYLFQGMGLSNEILRHRLDPGGVLEGDLLPAHGTLSAVEASLVDFVYLDGFDHAVAEFRDGGWKALDRVMAGRRSTRQLLHPGRSAPTNEFPRPEPPAGGEMRLVDEDTLGEQAIVVLISHGTGKDNLGLLAADGWAGGRLYRWEEEGDERGVTEWITRWDSGEAAADFVYGFSRALTSRFPEAAIVEIEGGRSRLTTPERLFAIALAGNEVRIEVAHPRWAAMSASEP